MNSSSNTVPSFTILQWNVRSLVNRALDLSSLLVDHNCVIAIISETWLFPQNIIILPQYDLFRSDRPDGYGNVLIAAHQSVQVRSIFINDHLKTLLSQF